MWADNFGIMSHSKGNLEHMPRKPVEEAGKWDLAAKPASLWWTSAYDSEEKNGLSFSTMTGRHRFPLEENSRSSAVP